MNNNQTTTIRMDIETRNVIEELKDHYGASMAHVIRYAVRQLVKEI